MQPGPYREATFTPLPRVAAWHTWSWRHIIPALLLPVAEAIYAQRFAEYLIAPVVFGATLTLLFWALPHHGDLLIHEERSGARAHARASRIWLSSVVSTLAVFVVLRVAGARHERAAADAVSHAVERFRADHGEYPPTLEALIPRYLPQIPTPYRVSGEGCVFLYEREARGATLGRLDYVAEVDDCRMNHGVVYDFPSRRWVECDGLRCPVPPLNAAPIR
ncbi:MAG: hypothetical protein Q8S73_44165 [Deltaproteobacteria bacterium]|nr:hypothetical protein [Myxococcales bacterium]MDP3221160.1 hypothetical protein [Deltaproteobacteria bacterium]